MDATQFNTAEIDYILTVRYFDTAPVAIYANYVSNSTGARTWKDFTISGSKSWKTHTVILTDADLATKVNGKAALYLFASSWAGTDMVLSEITLQAVTE